MLVSDEGERKREMARKVFRLHFRSYTCEKQKADMALGRE